MTKKILVTLGPASLSQEIVEAMDNCGVHLFRVNLSHTPLELVELTIKKIQSWTEVPICLDSEGAQMRNRDMAGGSITYQKGDRVQIPFAATEGTRECISFTPPGIVREFRPGDLIRVDFNHVTLRVTKTTSDACLAEVLQGGTVGSNKAADADRTLPLDSITVKDRAAIEIGRRNDINNFALSFTNKKSDVIAFRELCGNEANIICKIESRTAIANLSAILEATDEILIDRGDLSRTIKIEKIPFLQRRIISTAKAVGKQVYVATNLLKSMITSQAPNRAEVNDVVSTLLMGADGLVLAAETAIGAFPERAVLMVSKLIDEVDRWTPNSSLNEILGNS